MSPTKEGKGRGRPPGIRSRQRCANCLSYKHRRIDCPLHLYSLYLVYGLKDPRTGQIRYVGRSSIGFIRPYQHVKAARKGERTYKANWIRSLLKLGLTYEITVLEEARKENLAKKERFWLRRLRPLGHLTNTFKELVGYENEEPNSTVSHKFDHGPEQKETTEIIWKKINGRVFDRQVACVKQIKLFGTFTSV